MPDSQPAKYPVTFTTQAFLILCRLFDGCYDDCKQQEHMVTTVEGAAQSLLTGVAHLQEAQTPPKDVTVTFGFDQIHFLRKLVTETLAVLPPGEGQEKSREWLGECLNKLEQAAVV